MRSLGLLAILVGALLNGCAMRKYQVVVIETSNGQMARMDPQNRIDADKKALAVNAMSQGQALAWVQRVQKSAKTTTPDIKPPRVSEPQ